jgi:hypothetical protein
MQVNGEQTDHVPEADVGLGLLTRQASHKLPHPEIGDEKRVFRDQSGSRVDYFRMAVICSRLAKVKGGMSI